MSRLTDTELMAALRVVPQSAWPLPVRRDLVRMQRDGLNVTVYEIIANGALIFVEHETPKPSVEAIRMAYEELTREAVRE